LSDDFVFVFVLGKAGAIGAFFAKLMGQMGLDRSESCTFDQCVAGSVVLLNSLL
jgi:hypothetical protein